MSQKKPKLSLLKKAQLISIIEAVYDIYDDIDKIVDRHLLAQDEQNKTGSNTGEIMQQQIQQLAKEKTFITYNEVISFSSRLQSLLIDIDTLVREESAETALQLMDSFLEVMPEILHRVDDSNGNLSDTFKDAVELWLDIAQQIRAEQPQSNTDWVKMVIDYYDNNDYGLFDEIISGADNLLTETELKQLAWRFEKNLKKALKSKAQKNTPVYNQDASHASLGMQAVAEALKDIELFEKSILIQFPRPNSSQKTHLAEFALSLGKPEQALKWLAETGNGPFEYQRQILFNECLRQQGNTDELKQILQQEYEQAPSLYTLQTLLETIDKPEQETLAQQVLIDAPEHKNIEEAINMLIAVNFLDAASELLLLREKELINLHYSTLLTWLESFKNNKNTLASILCYRALLNDLLNRGYSKAYHHAADYFNQLLVLDRTINDYQNLPNAKEYILLLQKKHPRKRSFWQQLNYPDTLS